MGLIEERFDYYETNVGDIDEHMQTLLYYAIQSRKILELGTRKLVSTWAFFMARPEVLHCVDIVHPNEYGFEAANNLQIAEVASKAEGIKFKFFHADDLSPDLKLLKEYDMIFIDTDHTYDQMKKELKIYGNRARKYLAFHDTNVEEMTKAILEFVEENKQWFILERSYVENGIIVLKRVGA